MNIYKICDAKIWKDARESGLFHGAGIDLEDGYIHFSTTAQLADTARLHFRHREGQLLITVDTSRLDLTWEPSRGGDLFPHLYDSLPMDAVTNVQVMPLDADGVPCPEGGFPEG